MTVAGPILAKDIPGWWHEIGPLLCRALRHGRGEYDEHQILARLCDGRWVLVGLIKDGALAGVAACEVVRHDRDGPAHLWVVMGSGSDAPETVQAMWSPIQNLARANNCTEVRVLGRRGWARSGAMPAGFRHTHDLLSYTMEA